MIDYIIVGNGLAGISFSEIALNANKKILVFDNNSQPSSRVAGGLYNPVVLKRFSEVWKAKEQIDFAFPLYHQIQKYLPHPFPHTATIPANILRFSHLITRGRSNQRRTKTALKQKCKWEAISHK